MPWWGGLIIGIGALVIGGVLGFLITKKIVQKQLRDNPPITEKQIRAMYMQMGRKPSETDIKKVMNSMKRAK
ncbi:YneF family protein [Spiroplasma endosymbiont of Polydrusus pterygomalis]|uniref:YneF family protein n=1 Tax=Spiroplasma endosymbiont of Polydrusus pterygomalis TaxID=3139327 RepID=UPI003CCB60DD